MNVESRWVTHKKRLKWKVRISFQRIVLILIERKILEFTLIFREDFGSHEDCVLWDVGFKALVTSLAEAKCPNYMGSVANSTFRTLRWFEILFNNLAFKVELAVLAILAQLEKKYSICYNISYIYSKKKHLLIFFSIIMQKLFVEPVIGCLTIKLACWRDMIMWSRRLI